MTTATITRRATGRRAPVCLGKADPRCTAEIHGTPNAYASYRCRCATAREAWRVYNKRRREGRHEPNCIDVTGSSRRIRALIAIGWSMRTLARKTGHHHRTVQDVAYARRRLITRQTAKWVSDLYEELSTTPGGSKYALTVAARHGWAPPLAWDEGAIDNPNAQPDLGDTERTDDYDELTVALAVDGRLTHAQLAAHWPDLLETVRRLARRMTDVEIALHLRWPGYDDGPPGKTRGQNNVGQLRHRNGIPGPPKHEAVHAYPTRRPDAKRRRRAEQAA